MAGSDALWLCDALWLRQYVLFSMGQTVLPLAVVTSTAGSGSGQTARTLAQTGLRQGALQLR